MSPRILALSVVILALCGRVTAAGLEIGSPAPKIEVKEFVKGDPVKSFEKGKIYVVEFWATWCPPCRTSIPHLTALQKKQKDVVFIGVSVLENDWSAVKPFVKDMAEKMDYRVAMDDVGNDMGREGKMSKNWMTAAEQGGIPTAFIINGEGKIAWIGHPMKMEKPLNKIVAGKWDVNKAAADYKSDKALDAKFNAVTPKIVPALRMMDFKAAVSATDEILKETPALEKRLGMFKFQWLIKIGDNDKVVEYGNHLVDKVYMDDDETLNAIAWTLVEKPGAKPDPKLMKFALHSAEAADKVTEGKDGQIADTLAKAYYETGNYAKALETQERAVKLVKGTDLEKDKGIQERLELYKKKAAKQ